MNILYSDSKQNVQEVLKNKTIFLAGPTPRSKEVESWRPEAVAILEQLGFKGVVIIPERRDWEAKFEYFDQTDWESETLTGCNVIVFWVPRDLTDMPAFTTNVEFGRFVGQHKIWELTHSLGFPVPPAQRQKIVGPKYDVVYGRPDDAPNNRYLDWLYTKSYGTQPYNTLLATLAEAVRRIG